MKDKLWVGYLILAGLLLNIVVGVYLNRSNPTLADQLHTLQGTLSKDPEGPLGTRTSLKLVLAQFPNTQFSMSGNWLKAAYVQDILDNLEKGDSVEIDVLLSNLEYNEQGVITGLDSRFVNPYGLRANGITYLSLDDLNEVGSDDLRSWHYYVIMAGALVCLFVAYRGWKKNRHYHKSTATIPELEAAYRELLAPYPAAAMLVDNYWQALEKAYTANGRYYHDLRHIHAMLQQASTISAQLEDPEVVSFSIFYHDIVYNVKRKDNEEQSALVAKELLTVLGLEESRIERCYHQIIATKAHGTNDDPDANYLVDIDLGILATDAEHYHEYTREIRKEYSIYPGFMYRPGRKKVLQHFLAMDQIYKTEHFRNLYESKARQNLQTELNRL